MLGLEFSSGKLEIYELEDVRTAAEIAAGSKPKQKLAYVGWTYFGDRTASLTRIYEALGADERFDRLVRIPVDVNIHVGQYVAIGNVQYRVNILNLVVVKSNYRAQELTLVRLEDRYDLDTVQN